MGAYFHKTKVIMLGFALSFLSEQQTPNKRPIDKQAASDKKNMLYGLEFTLCILCLSSLSIGKEVMGLLMGKEVRR